MHLTKQAGKKTNGKKIIQTIDSHSFQTVTVPSVVMRMHLGLEGHSRSLMSTCASIPAPSTL
jgi:hypothetical protein